MAASPVAANRSAAPLHAASSSGSGDSYGGGFSPSSSNPPSSSSDSSSSPNGAASPPLDPRSSANTSELLRAVLKRRAERLQRQQDPTTSAYLPAAPPEQQQQQQAEPSAQQQQQSQQQPPLQQAPPRYKPHWNSSGPDGSAPVNGAATHLNRAAAAAAAHLNGAAAGPYGGSAAAPLNGAYNGAYNGAAAAPAAPPPPAPPSPASLPPVPAPEQRVVRAAAAAAVREDAISQRKLATVRFWLKFKAEWGQRLKVVGSHQELGGQGWGARAWRWLQQAELRVGDLAGRPCALPHRVGTRPASRAAACVFPPCRCCTVFGGALNPCCCRVGSPSAGGWLLAAAPELKWSQGDNWHTTVQLPAGAAEVKLWLAPSQPVCRSGALMKAAGLHSPMACCHQAPLPSGPSAAAPVLSTPPFVLYRRTAVPQVALWSTNTCCWTTLATTRWPGSRATTACWRCAPGTSWWRCLTTGEAIWL